eukprot:Awhi_evm1s12698
MGNKLKTSVERSIEPALFNKGDVLRTGEEEIELDLDFAKGGENSWGDNGLFSCCVLILGEEGPERVCFNEGEDPCLTKGGGEQFRA